MRPNQPVDAENQMSKAKIRALILNTGYVESASLADVFVYKDDGHSFDNPEEGLRQLMEDLINFEKAEFEQYSKTLEMTAPDVSSAEYLEKIAHDFIHGSMQTHGQFLNDYGWNTNCWGEANAAVYVASAHQLMAHLWLNKGEKAKDLSIFRLNKIDLN
jgi:hypothetical protein